MIGKTQRLLWAVPLGLCVAAVGWCEKPIEATVCQLKADPPTYNQKIVRVTGFVSHGFEDFTFFDPQCSPWPGVWLEYGGQANSGTIYLGGGKAERRRPKDLMVEGIPIPLTVNKQFEEFDKAIQPPFRSGNQGAILRATLVGRFFAGRKLELFKGKPWGGFGHMGCCSLLAIQEIEAADTQNHPELDYDTSTEPPGIENTGCASRGLLPLEESATVLQWQKEADHGDHTWAFYDPKRVALEALSRQASVDISSVKNLRLRREPQGRKVYLWRPKSKSVSYVVVISRPYWLSFYAQDAGRVAWAAIAVIESSCHEANAVTRTK